MNASGKASMTLVLEWAVWFALAAAGYWLTFEFDEPLDVYEFGASGWPRFILVCIVVGATVQLFLGLQRGRREAAGPADDEAPSAPADSEAEARSRRPVSPTLIGIFVLPLIYLLLLPRTGFFLTTPFFIAAFLWVLQVRRLRLLIGVTATVYGLVLLIFVRLFYVALPVGNWPGFYDVNNWIVVAVRNVLAGG